MAVGRQKPEVLEKVGAEMDLCGLTKQQVLEFYRQMVMCRAFEDHVYYLFLQGILPGTVHQSQGQEAVAVGVCSQ